MGKRSPKEVAPIPVTAASDRSSSDTEVVALQPHRLEQEVQRKLLAHPRLKFSSLVIRRIENGVCLEGVLEADDDAPDVIGLAQKVAGVEEVLNHLVIRRPHRPPAKG